MTEGHTIEEGFKVYLPEEKMPTENIDDIVGLEEVKKHLMSILKTLQKESMEQLKAWEIKPRGNVLIVGPFGIGKTSLVRALAKKEHLPLVELNVAELLIQFPNQTDFRQILDKIHTAVKDIGTCMILLDEFEPPSGLFTKGDIEGIQRSIYRFIKEFCTFYENSPRLLIAVTSYPIEDEGILNFFDHHILINKLDEKTRFAILNKYLEKTNIDPSINLETLLGYYASKEVTGGFSGGELKRLVQGAAYKAIYEGRKEISENDFETAYRQLKKTHYGDLRIHPYKMDKKVDRLEDPEAIQKLNSLELEVARLRWMIIATSQIMHHALRLAFSDSPELIKRFFEHFDKDKRPYSLQEISYITGMEEDTVKKILAKKYFSLLFPKLGKRGRVVAFNRELLEKIMDEFTFTPSSPTESKR